MKNSGSTLGMGLTQISLGGWNLNCHSMAISMSSSEKDTLVAHAKNWARIFPKGDGTLAFELFNVPSVIIRFDYSLETNGKVNVYEIEDRPMGIAHGVSANKQLGIEMTRIFNLLREKIGRKISIFVTPSRLNNSDDLLLKTCAHPIFDEHFASIEEIDPTHALIVRSLRDESAYWPLEKMSLSTVSMEGWKGYGKIMGFWKDICETPDFNVPFVVKPEFGCRGENVYLFHPAKKSTDGFSTKTKILRAIDEKLVRYIQPYHQPENPDFLVDEYNMIRRVYLGYNPANSGYECLGGMWMARKSVKVHGASDAISGAIVL